MPKIIDDIARRYEVGLIDFDGTIIDADSVLGAVWVDTCRKWGLELTSDRASALVKGRPAKVVVDELFPNFTSNDRIDFLNDLEGVEEVAEYKPITGVRNFLEMLHSRKVRLAVVTTSWTRKVEISLERFKMTDLFEAIVTREMVERSKPDPESYLVALKVMSVQNGRAFAVEDSATGVKAAKSANLYCLGVGSSELVQAGADLVRSSFPEFL